MKLRTILLSTLFALAGVQAPVNALPGWGWTSRLSSLAQSNTAAVVALAGFSIHGLVSAYDTYKIQANIKQSRIDAATKLKELHLHLATHTKETSEYAEILKQINNVSISDLSNEVAQANGNLVSLLTQVEPDHGKTAQAYTKLYNQINKEVKPHASFAIPSIVSEVINTPDLYVPFIF